MDYNKIWENVLDKIKEITTQISFETWFLPLKIRKIDNDLNIVYIEVNSDNRSEFIITTIKNRYLSTLETAFKEVLEDNFRVVLKDSDQYRSEEVREEPKIKPKKQLLDKEKIFNPRFSFENFVVGNSNKYAHAAALAVAESPSEAYNPLFIYGGSGLGKTHLMHAIGIYLLENNPKLNVLYVSSEMFTNELIKALNTHKMNEFKSKYRKADVLLKKAENMGINTDENPEIYDVACMIAEKIKDNIRELEGALIRVVSFSQLLNEKLDKNFTKRTLKDIFSNVERTVTPEKIKKTVCKYYGIKITDIESSKKTNNIAFPRQIAMYLIREMTDYSLPKIGQFFGGKHYTTVLYACEKIDDELSMDKNLREVIENIKEEIKD